MNRHMTSREATDLLRLERRVPGIVKPAILWMAIVTDVAASKAAA